MILVDSSFWISFEHGRVRFDDYVPSDETVATCPAVVMEVIRGARDRERAIAARDLLTNVEMFDAPTPLARFEGAARIYAQCRAEGVTAGSIDCLIAATALAYNVPVLHLDGDFELMARVIPTLRTFSRS